MSLNRNSLESSQGKNKKHSENERKKKKDKSPRHIPTLTPPRFYCSVATGPTILTPGADHVGLVIMYIKLETEVKIQFVVC